MSFAGLSSVSIVEDSVVVIRERNKVHVPTGRKILNQRGNMRSPRKKSHTCAYPSVF